MFFTLAFPAIDPIAIEVGPIAIRWYALAYIAGLLGGWRYLRYLGSLGPVKLDREAVDDFLVWATLGVVLGGRIGYVLFYQLDYYLENPLGIVQVWKGGMAFHGGFLGVVVASLWFARKMKIPALGLGDMVACVAPIGLFFGRLANFINGELFGRHSDVPWAIVFPRGGPYPRHPSQLYEAGLEGLLLFTLLFVLARRQEIRQRHGLLMGIFIAGYGLSRSFVELFRQPDIQIGFLAGGSTMGQWLSVPMILIGLGLIVHALKAKS